jgi:hypothetical protein
MVKLDKHAAKAPQLPPLPCAAAHLVWLLVIEPKYDVRHLAVLVWHAQRLNDGSTPQDNRLDAGRVAESG